MPKHQYLSIDIGGTQIKSALMDESGAILEKSAVATPDSLAPFLKRLKKLIRPYRSRIQGVAVCAPGKVDTVTGEISFGGSLTFLHQFNPRTYIKEHFGLPASVINDGKAAALAELWLGNLQGIENGAALILGTGVGGGIIVNGQLLEGEHFQAGELSFMAEPGGAMSPQRLLGLNGSAVRMIAACAQVLGQADETDGPAVFAAINQKDSRVEPIFQSYCQTIAYLIYNVQAVLDIRRVVIGGGISAQDRVRETISQHYQTILEGLGHLRFMVTPIEIEVCRNRNEANLLGALYQFFRSQETDMAAV